MNLLEATVTEIVGEPYFQFGKWWLKVKYNCYGSISETELMFSEESNAKSIKIGHKFLT